MQLADLIIAKNIPGIRSAIMAGADVNDIDPYGFTPIIEAAIVDSVEIASLLIEAGADVNGKDMTEGTALHWAAENNNIELCELLLKHNANANAYNRSGQPVLLNPILRQQNELKALLYHYGAKLTYAQDYINTKLLGHRFELTGHVDIVDYQKKFVEIDLEGFFLEFTTNVITRSLIEYVNNYASRNFREHFKILYYVITAFQNACELIKYQQYQTDLDAYHDTIHQLLSSTLKIIPINFEGHAITLVALDDLLAICDRRSAFHALDTVGIYRMGQPAQFSEPLIKQLIYELKSGETITRDLSQWLQLRLIAQYPIHKQITGNCSWANVEAALPLSIALLTIDFDQLKSPIIDQAHASYQIFEEWREWDKDRALHFCIESFYEANHARQASKCALLACILFQRCGINNELDMKRARKIIRVLKTPGYEYIIKSYRQIYEYNKKTPAGINFRRMLELLDDEI